MGNSSTYTSYPAVAPKKENFETISLTFFHRNWKTYNKRRAKDLPKRQRENVEKNAIVKLCFYNQF